MKQQNADLVNPSRYISCTFVPGPQVKEAASTDVVPASITPRVLCVVSARAQRPPSHSQANRTSELRNRFAHASRFSQAFSKAATHLWIWLTHYITIAYGFCDRN